MKTITELKMVTGGKSDNFKPTLAQCGFAEDFLAASDKLRFATEREAQIEIVFFKEIDGVSNYPEIVGRIINLFNQDSVNTTEMNSVIQQVQAIYDAECPK